MTTKSTKPTVRETSAYVRDKGLRPLIVTVSGSLLELRPKGLKRGEVIDLASVWSFALKARMALERAEKAKARAARRKAR